jgi:hypothetical protein
MLLNRVSRGGQFFYVIMTVRAARSTYSLLSVYTIQQYGEAPLLSQSRGQRWLGGDPWTV